MLGIEYAAAMIVVSRRETRTESVLDIDSCEITDNGSPGLFAGALGSATILVRGDSYVARHGIGIAANPGGNVRMENGTIEQNRVGVGSVGGDIVMGGALITDNVEGIALGQGTSGGLDSVIVENNERYGIGLSGGSSFGVNSMIVRNNGGDEIQVNDLSTLTVDGGGQDPSQIIDNGGWGINCSGPPAVTVLGGQALFDPLGLVLTGNTEGDTTCQ